MDIIPAAMLIQKSFYGICPKIIGMAKGKEEALEMVRSLAEGRKKNGNTDSKRKLYYISAEFLIGKLLSNNLINLGIYDEIKQMLAANGKDINEIEDAEPEPSLGNGGLGRLAACFLDSIATLGLNGDGIGLNYHLGLFRQEFNNNFQKELPDPWIESQSWLNGTGTSYEVQFGGGITVRSRLYDIDVTGYNNRTNTLHLFDLESVSEAIVHNESIDFDKNDIKRNLTLFLYPDDSDEAGRLLRIYQQYFMVSNAAQLILDECTARGCNLHDLPEYAVIQINDTHPSMIIPELIRILTQRGISFDEAVGIVSHTCAYTNHTILAEALETWPAAYLEKAVPQLVPIIRELDRRVRERFTDESVYIIDSDERVHMAHMDIHYGFSVNGVAYLHTEILKNKELNNFYKIYPDKFNNKTNGITFRRWLIHCNEPLTDMITQLIGDGFRQDAMQLEKLAGYAGDEKVLNRLLEVKMANKRRLKKYILDTQGIDIDENSIFDIQVKRLHEYKRQHLNALHILAQYNALLENPDMDFTPKTYIFAAKAAPGYYLAKQIIKMIWALSEEIRKNPRISDKLSVYFLENYCVTMSELLMPACDISEQISLAGTEASGTGNMKLMLNGAITLGTLDGANIEIGDAVGPENILIFGMKTEEVNTLKARGYRPEDYYNNNLVIKSCIDRMYAGINGCKFTEVADSLRTLDPYMVLADFDSYCQVQEHSSKLYTDKDTWTKMSLHNIANAGIFSADRAVNEYAKDIWNI